MSYAGSAALQAAVYQRLAGWSGLTGVQVVDALPPKQGKGTFVILGPENANDKSDVTGGGAEHLFTVSVISDAKGFMEAKTAAAEVSDALVGASLTLTRGSLIDLTFVRAAARRLNTGDARRIDLTFRARVSF